MTNDERDRPQDDVPGDEPTQPQPAASGGAAGDPAPSKKAEAGEAAGPRRLTRASRDRVIAGVAGGLGRYFNVDPIFFRIGFVALSFFGGTGIFLYIAAWIFVPPEGGSTRTPGERSRAWIVIGAVALLIAGIAIMDEVGHHDGWGWGWWWWGGFLVPLLLIAAGAALIWKLHEDRRRAGGAVDAGWIVGRIALVVAVLAGSAILFCGSALAAAAGGGAAVAGIVIAIGVLIVIAAFRGGARWLVVPALLMAFPLGVVSAADIDLDGGVGDREYRPASASELRERYELGVGRLEVDLRDARLPAGDRSLELDLGIGEAVLIVPEDVCVALDARVGAGYARLFDRDSGGLDIDWGGAPDSPRNVPHLSVDASVGMGALEVVHDPDDVRRHRDERWFDGGGVEDSEGNTGCERGRAVGSGGSEAGDARPAGRR